MDMLLLLGLVATFGALTLLVVGVTSTVVERRAVYRTLRTARVADVDPTQVRERELSSSAFERIGVPLLQKVAGAWARFTPVDVVRRLDEELTYAGSPSGWDGERLLALKIVATVGGAILGLVLGGFLGIGLLRGLILAPILAGIGYYAPEWVVRSRSSKRQFRIRRQLPDALDLLSITVEAGLGFDAALERVAREVRGPLGEELVRVVQEIRLGKSRSEALRDLGERTNVDELRSFVLAMVQADIFGISISRVLQVQAKELRIRRRQLAEEQAQKLPVKIVFPLILCIFPALFVVLLGPAAITIYENIIAKARAWWPAVPVGTARRPGAGTGRRRSRRAAPWWPRPSG
jgi:tight adherence protein C